MFRFLFAEVLGNGFRQLGPRHFFHWVFKQQLLADQPFEKEIQCIHSANDGFRGPALLIAEPKPIPQNRFVDVAKGEIFIQPNQTFKAVAMPFNGFGGKSKPAKTFMDGLGGPANIRVFGFGASPLPRKSVPP